MGEVKVKVTQSCPTLWIHGLYSPWNSPGQNTRVGNLSLLQEIFPTQGSNPGLPHCRQILYQLSHKGSSEWEKIFANLISVKGLTSKIDKELIVINSKNKFFFLLKKWEKDPKRHFFQGRHKNGWQVYDKVLNITNHQGNTKQGRDETSLRTC